MLLPQQTIPLPPIFYAEETGQPFSTCLHCSCSLLDTQTPYLIEKAFRTYQPYASTDLVFEYAICLACFDTIWDTFSEASRQHLDAYFNDQVDPLARAQTLLEQQPLDVNHWVSHCFIKGTPATALTEYQLMAVGVGDLLVLSHVPCLIGGEALDEITTLLSKETRDELGGFMRDFFPQPPGLEEDFPIEPLLFL